VICRTHEKFPSRSQCGLRISSHIAAGVFRKVHRQPLPVSSATESGRYAMTAQRAAQPDAELVHILGNHRSQSQQSRLGLGLRLIG
jgi:hypothetical protein